MFAKGTTQMLPTIKDRVLSRQLSVIVPGHTTPGSFSTVCLGWIDNHSFVSVLASCYILKANSPWCQDSNEPD